jgi:hypothetical protein
MLGFRSAKFTLLLLLFPLFALLLHPLVALEARAFLADAGAAERPMLGALPFTLLLHFSRRFHPGRVVPFPKSRRVAGFGLVTGRRSYVVRGRVPGIIVGVVETRRSSSSAAAAAVPNGGRRWNELVFENVRHSSHR